MKNRFVNVAAIQNAVTDNLDVNLKRTLKLVEQAAKKGAQIIALQELYRTLYFPQYHNEPLDKYAETIPGESTKAFAAIAKKYKCVIVVPIYERTKAGKYFNAAAVIDHTGKLLPTYHKVHIPQDPLFYEKEYFQEGASGYRIYKTKYGNVAVLICYDQWFPEAARTVTLQGADIIFYPTAIGYIVGHHSKDGEWHNAWETIQRSHAIANGVHVVAINRVGTEDKLRFWGQSFIADSFGTVVKRGSKTKDEIVMAKVNLGHNEHVREGWGFFRNRRPDTYSRLLKK